MTIIFQRAKASDKSFIKEHFSDERTLLERAELQYLLEDHIAEQEEQEKNYQKKTKDQEVKKYPEVMKHHPVHLKFIISLIILQLLGSN